MIVTADLVICTHIQHCSPSIQSQESCKMSQLLVNVPLPYSTAHRQSKLSHKGRHALVSLRAPFPPLFSRSHLSLISPAATIVFPQVVSYLLPLHFHHHRWCCVRTPTFTHFLTLFPSFSFPSLYAPHVPPQDRNLPHSP